MENTKNALSQAGIFRKYLRLNRQIDCGIKIIFTLSSERVM
jgi:hypothetical protein